MVEGARRLTGAMLPLPSIAVGDDLPSLSSLAQRRLLTAAAGLLGAVEGLPDVPELPHLTSAGILADPALRLRRELERAGAIRPRG